VTTTLIVVADVPTASGRAPDAAWDVTGVPPTVTVAPVDVTVGVTVTDATLFATVKVYEAVPEEKATFRDPSLNTSAVKVFKVFTALALLTVTVYVFCVEESPAVHITTIALLPPAGMACAEDTLPDVTAALDTVIVVPLSVAVGVSVTDAIPFAMDAV
jgi:hypothetical protein